MQHRSILWLVLFYCAFLSFVAKSEETHPNLLVCLSDDHAARLLDSLDKLGSPINPTPHLSRIAKSGFSHRNAYCTSAISAKTAFCILTGLVKGSNLETFDHSNFIGHSFKKLGYKTAFFGTWTWEYEPKFYGFDYWSILEDQAIFFNPKIKDPHNDFIIEGHSTDIITDLAIRWFQEESLSEKPFFVLVSYPSTRRPWIPPIRKIDTYDKEWFETPDTFFTDFSHRTPANKYQRMNIAHDLDLIDDLFFESLPDTNKSKQDSSILAKNLASMNDEQQSAWALSWKAQNEAFARESLSDQSLGIWKFQRFIKNYLRCLLAMDENIGRLVDSIKLQSEQALSFVYTSERGRFTGEFGWFGSEWMYEP
ncbi:MAG: sulfatase-like hydrolase/transferase, partial [Opitutae bacterium]